MEFLNLIILNYKYINTSNIIFIINKKIKYERDIYINVRKIKII